MLSYIGGVASLKQPSICKFWFYLTLVGALKKLAVASFFCYAFIPEKARKAITPTAMIAPITTTKEIQLIAFLFIESCNIM